MPPTIASRLHQRPIPQKTPKSLTLRTLRFLTMYKPLSTAALWACLSSQVTAVANGERDPASVVVMDNGTYVINP